MKIKFRQWQNDHMKYFHIGPNRTDNIDKIIAAPTMLGFEYYMGHGYGDVIIYEDDIVKFSYESPLMGLKGEYIGIIERDDYYFSVIIPDKGQRFAVDEPGLDVVEIIGHCYNPKDYDMETGEVLLILEKESN